MNELPERRRPREPARWMVAIAVTAALVFGGATRIALVLSNESPLFLWDDAVIHLEVQYLHDLGSAVNRAIAEWSEERVSGRDLFRVEEAVDRFRREARGVPPTFGRPFHDLAALGVYETLSQRPPYLGRPSIVQIEGARLWAVPLTSAFASTLTIPLAFLLARRLWGSAAGLRASAVLAASGGHLLYSIEGFSEALLVLFLFAALLVFARSREALTSKSEQPLQGTLALGLVLGAGMLVHFRFSILALIFLGSEALLYRAPAPIRRHTTQRLFRIIAGIGVMLALAELPYYVLLLAAKQRGIPIHPRTYLEQVLFVLAPQGLGYAGSLVRFHLENLLTYPFALAYLSGLVVTLLSALGFVAVLRDRRSPSAVPESSLSGVTGTLLALFALPLLFYSSTIPLLRYGATSFALAPLLAARAIGVFEERAEVSGSARRRSVIASLLMLGAMAEGGVTYLNRIYLGNAYLSTVASPRFEAIQTPTGPAPSHITTMPPISWVLHGPKSAVPVPATEAEIRKLVSNGARYLVVDSLVDFMSFEGQGFPAQEALLRKLMHQCKQRPLMHSDVNIFGASLIHDLELNYRPFLQTLALHRNAPERGAARITVYDLHACEGLDLNSGGPPSP